MLNDLGVRQKLNLLLFLPLFAVVCTIIPFTVERVDDARAAAVTAHLARLAREVGGLVQDLQQERAIALAYLVLPSTDRSAVVIQQQLVDDAVARMRADGPEPDIGQALDRVGELDQQRQQVLSGTASTVTVYHAYRDAIQALLDALHLAARDGVDAVGLRQLFTLDALLRTNHVASDVAAGLVIAAADRGTGAPLLAAALTAERQQRDRFRQLATGQQSALLDIVEQGPSGQRVAGITARLSSTGIADVAEDVPTALGVANAYGRLRQIVEDRIASDIASAADVRERNGRSAALGVGSGAVLVLALVISLSIRVSRSIASPLRRLSRAAGAVADIASAELVRVDDADESVPRPTRLAAVNVRGQDEIGELAAAINRVQATAALLLERQVSTQRNVAIMFANIARRTQSLVTRQLSLIDDMERNEQDAMLLEKLYRLDHLTTRLRRSADSLLVVSGNRDEELVVPTPLVTVIRAAAGEIEGFRAVRLGRVCDIVIAADLVADLRLLLAELLENATAFSPPGAFVEVSAELGDGCRITVADYGIGMPLARMQEENRRIVERPRLDVAPTEVLGLFVVGRLARRHGLTVRLDPTPGQGVTATVLIPSRMYAVPRQPPAHVAAAPAVAPVAALLPGPTRPTPAGSAFSWFDGSGRLNGHPAAAAPAPAVSDRPTAPLTAPAAVNGADHDRSRNGLTRRTPGLYMTAFETRPANPAPAGLRDAEAEAAQLTAFMQGTERAAVDGQHLAPPVLPQVAPHPPIRGVAAVSQEPRATEPRPTEAGPAVDPQKGPHGLTRRTPGAHLFASARPNPSATTSSRAPANMRPSGPHRDPEAERAALDGFVEGLARATNSLNTHDPHNGKRQR
ncbi:nitrate- and nitrite sensing domain-containing protein [Dactylosporangium sucinum]|uniref:histidine kinase n=1 Tax=Dactylosporangium sucinum TaxID=1424081 RepID=A0A917WXR3_9ACTN|nr:nitrate- and nitrite sensing domain-containing protein [Dactylosporangium sucinum]GGM37644.1 histidine kinase [Dactylosporangium sucinum]